MGIGHSLFLELGSVGSVVTAMLFPGIFGSMIIGNVHAFSLSIAAGINGILYFLIVWMICRVSRRAIGTFK